VHQNVFRGLAPHVGLKWKRKDGRGRGLSGVSNRDKTITDWLGDK